MTKPQHFHGFFIKIVLPIFLVKLTLSTAKKPKTTTFSRVFHPKKFGNFLGKSKLNFWTKNEDFEQCDRVLKLKLSILFSLFQVLNSGANVILTTGGIDDLCLKYFVEAGAMAVRRCKKVDLKRIAKATGATLITSLANLEGEESFEASYVGEAAEVAQKRICDDELILITGPKQRTAASIILRGPNDFYCDEMERSVHDSLCVVKRVMESKNVVVGGGTVEAALSIYLENFATTLSSREQLAIGNLYNFFFRKIKKLEKKGKINIRFFGVFFYLKYS